jgi:predicted PurR-regulated permease PerM
MPRFMEPLFVTLVQGILGGLMFWWLDLPAPLLWGAVMAVVAITPVFGAALIWVPAAIFLALGGSWEKALVLTAWGGIVVALIDNLLYPVLIGKDLRMHTVPVFIAIVGGLIVFGASGLVLGRWYSRWPWCCSIFGVGVLRASVSIRRSYRRES